MVVPQELRGIDAKIKRAVENVRSLDAEISNFLSSDPKPHRIVREVEEQGRAYAWKAFQETDVPLRFAVIAGEVIHQLRSSLDHLICAMVLRRGNTIGKQAFPVTAKAEEFKKATKRGMVQGISLSARNIVESLQPYNAGNDPKASFLNILHESNLTDKHRLLVVVTSVTMVETIEVTLSGVDDTVPLGERYEVAQTSEVRPLARLIKGGEIVARTTFGRKHSNLDAHAEFAAHVAFEKFGPIDLYPVIPGLTQLADYTASAVKQFQSEF